VVQASFAIEALHPNGERGLLLKNQENAVFYVSQRKLKHFKRLKIYLGLRIICKIEEKLLS
jgi:hypothetical protein